MVHAYKAVFERSPRHTRGTVSGLYTAKPPAHTRSGTVYGLYTAAHGHMFTSNHEQGGNVSKHTLLERVCTLGSVQACRAWHCSAGQVQVSRHAPPS